MPNIEVDESQWQSAQQTLQTLNAMLKNPKSRQLLNQAQKAYDPNIVIPEIDAAEPVHNELKALREEMAKDRKAREDSEARAIEERSRQNAYSAWEKGRTGLRSQGWEQQGIDNIEKLMQERGIPDHEAAAALYEKLNPPPAPVDPVTNKFNYFAPRDDKEQKLDQLLMEKKDDQYLQAIVPQILAEYRSGRGR